MKHEAKFQRDFIGDFGDLRFRGFFLKLHLFCGFVFSPATSQEGVEQPARPQELSRAHNVHVLFDVWYILLSQSLSL